MASRMEIASSFSAGSPQLLRFFLFFFVGGNAVKKWEKPGEAYDKFGKTQETVGTPRKKPKGARQRRWWGGKRRSVRGARRRQKGAFVFRVSCAMPRVTTSSSRRPRFCYFLFFSCVFGQMLFCRIFFFAFLKPPNQKNQKEANRKLKKV